jgi:hypothetical protein
LKGETLVRQFNFLLTVEGSISLSSEHDFYKYVTQDEDLSTLQISSETKIALEGAFIQ